MAIATRAVTVRQFGERSVPRLGGARFERFRPAIGWLERISGARGQIRYAARRRNRRLRDSPGESGSRAIRILEKAGLRRDCEYWRHRCSPRRTGIARARAPSSLSTESAGFVSGCSPTATRHASDCSRARKPNLMVRTKWSARNKQSEPPRHRPAGREYSQRHWPICQTVVRQAGYSSSAAVADGGVSGLM